MSQYLRKVMNAFKKNKKVTIDQQTIDPDSLQLAESQSAATAPTDGNP